MVPCTQEDSSEARATTGMASGTDSLFSTVVIILSFVLLCSRPSGVHWWALTGARGKGMWLMTGAGVTSAPSMPVGSPTAAPSHSRCTYVWPPFPRAHTPVLPAQAMACFSSQGASPEAWSLSGPASSYAKAWSFDRTKSWLRGRRLHCSMCYVNSTKPSIITSFNPSIRQKFTGCQLLLLQVPCWPPGLLR